MLVNTACSPVTPITHFGSTMTPRGTQHRDEQYDTSSAFHFVNPSVHGRRVLRLFA